MVSVAGIRASNNVFSPSTALPRAEMPSAQARSMTTTSSPESSVLPVAFAPARRNAVPQIGPEVPPIREVMTTAIFFRKVPMSVRS